MIVFWACLILVLIVSVVSSFPVKASFYSVMISSMLHLSEDEGLDKKPVFIGSRDQALSKSSTQVDSVEWLTEQLRLALAIRRDDIMLGALNRLLAIDANNLDGLFYQANRYLLLEDIANAQLISNKLNQLAPDSKQAHSLRAQLSLFNENKKVYQSARLFAHAGRYEEALAYYERLFPQGMPTPRLMLEYLMLEGKLSSHWQSVRQKLEALNEQYPDVPDFQLALAQHLSKKEPDNPWALGTYERLSLRTDIGLQATRSWIEALDKLPITDELVQKYAFMARYYPSDLGITQAAIKATSRLENKAELQKDPVYMAKMQGLAFLEQGNNGAAEKKLTFVLRYLPQDAEVLGGLGLVALRQGQHQQALEWFTQAQAINEDPDQVSKWQSLVDTATYWGLLAQGDKALEDKDYLNAENHYLMAIKCQPETLEGLNRLAQLYVMAKQYRLADKWYKKVLQSAPLNQVALEGRLDILYAQNQPIAPLIKQYSPSQKKVIQPKLVFLQRAQLNNELQMAMKENDVNTAKMRLDELLMLGNDSPWQALDAANTLVTLAQKSRADRMMAQWVADAMDDEAVGSVSRAEWLFAYALYLSGQNQTSDAIIMLEKIEIAQRTPAMEANLTRLKVDEALLQIAQLRGDDPEQACEALIDVGQTYSDNLDVQITLAAVWLTFENSDVNSQRSHTCKKSHDFLSQLTPEADWSNSTQLRYGELLLKAQKLEQFERWFQQWRTQFVSLQDKKQLRVLLQKSFLQQAEKASFNQDYLLAIRLYNQAIAEPGPLLYEAKLGLLGAYIASNNQHNAKRLSETLYQERMQLTSVQSVSFAELLVRQGDFKKSKAMLTALQQRDDLDAIEYRDLMKVALDMKDETLMNEMAANALYHSEELSSVNPAINRPSLRSLYDSAEDDWLTRNVKADIDRVQARHQGHIAFGIDYGARDGANNFTQIPIEARIPMPDYDGHLLLRFDQVHIESGNIRYYDKALDEDTVPINQSDYGTALGVGWEADNWLVDLGTTPIGFNDHTWVGGINIAGELQDWSWTGGLSRRALTSTILSYGGLTVPANTSDPAGVEWGGVVSSGVKLNTSLDLGGPWGMWTSSQYHQITGNKVADNTRFGLLTGGYYKWINTEDERLSTGLNLMYLQYDKNVSEYTLGHGGYYSPQRYFSVSLPVNYYGRYQDTWAYWLRASVSQSWSQEDGPFLTPLSGSSGGGFGYAFLGAIEKRVSKKWYIGMSMDIERSDFYEPNHFILYARYTFTDRWQRIPTPPTPPLLYSEFD
ncbi:cellulose synthase subunit BcsC-related outer membrane protein [uncultured Shewanella sp.]|uniref:cellulose synthase subunit BcsC-related outer membrane protein n=1 Tax=uncultured Shewanella sp. TaxID=173975 RepID=UPI002613E369|nr:cellulose synthase subunit BcsC-related outer membrane protein [uncultured Shewanella sp.]